MKVKKLINLLKGFNPEGKVYLGNNGDDFGHDEDEIIGCYLLGDSEDVGLSTENDIAITSLIKSFLQDYVDGYADEIDTYQEMIDWGLTPNLLRKHNCKDEGDHMQKFCEEHGLM